jgi:hypothetical protein
MTALALTDWDTVARVRCPGISLRRQPRALSAVRMRSNTGNGSRP